MRSQIKLHLQPCTTVDLPFEKLCTLSSFPLKAGEASYITSDEGTLLVQSINHYLVHIQLYEYKIVNHSVIDIEIINPSFFLVAMLEGCSVLYNDVSEVISEISGNTVKMSYLNAGKYQRSLLAGDHTILLIAISPEWLISKYGELKELKGLIAAYRDKTKTSFSLPGFSMAQLVFSALRKLNAAPEGRDIDIDMHIFLVSCIRRYLVKLHARISLIEYQETKAKEIAQFILENYADKIVDDEPALASYFMISTVTLTRLMKLHFGRPLHKQIIELRMHNGLKLLLTTKKSVQEIAVTVGYDDPYYFSRAFKRRFGITANAVRVSVL